MRKNDYIMKTPSIAFLCSASALAFTCRFHCRLSTSVPPPTPRLGTKRVNTDTALSTADGSVLLLSRAVLQWSTAAAQYTHLLTRTLPGGGDLIQRCTFCVKRFAKRKEDSNKPMQLYWKCAKYFLKVPELLSKSMRSVDAPHLFSKVIEQ